MKNRILVLNELLKMQESHSSIHEMVKKLQRSHMSYYETVNVLHEVTHKSLSELSELLLKDEYWQNMKIKTDETEEVLKNEYEAMVTFKVKKQRKFDEHIKETYQNLIDHKKAKEKKLKNLDKTLNELFHN